MKSGKEKARNSHKQNQKGRISLDHASTTPVLPEVVLAMNPFFNISFANPSALYEEGVYAKNAVEVSRKQIASVLFAHPDEIIFTGSGTESANLALFGVVEALKSKISKPHIIVSAFEHPAILESVKKLEEYGVEVTYVYSNQNGYIEPKSIQKSLKENTVLVSIMYANNEIGTIEPIREIAKTIRLFRKQKKKSIFLPYFHTDASQAGNYLSLNTIELHVDLMTLDGSKMYGPKGIGLLFARRGIELSPQIVGGGQESGRRSGTENVASIVGLSKALSIVNNDKDKECKRLATLRDFAIKKILKNHKNAVLNGDDKNRLPNNINICFPNLDAEFAVIKLDSLGIACSSSSSCQTLSDSSTSYVITSIGKGKDCSESSLRFTLGRSTNKSDILKLISALKKVIK